MLEIERADFKAYAFTLRKTKDNSKATPMDYAKHICKLGHGGHFATFNNVVFEQTAGLHAHGIVTVRNSVPFKRFRVRGWKLHLKEIYDLDTWLLYLNKDQDDLLPDMIDPPDDDISLPPKKKLF